MSSTCRIWRATNCALTRGATNLAEVLSAETLNLCQLEVGDPPDRALGTIPDVLRLDPKLPIVMVLSGNDPELVLRCLQQGASDFLIQPFTSDQVEAALQKIARLQPLNNQTPGKVYCFMPAKGGCGASTIDQQFRLPIETDRR